MNKAVLRLDGLICLVVLVGAPFMALVSLINGDSHEALYWVAVGWPLSPTRGCCSRVGAMRGEAVRDHLGRRPFPFARARARVASPRRCWSRPTGWRRRW